MMWRSTASSLLGSSLYSCLEGKGGLAGEGGEWDAGGGGLMQSGGDEWCPEGCPEGTCCKWAGLL